MFLLLFSVVVVVFCCCLFVFNYSAIVCLLHSSCNGFIFSASLLARPLLSSSSVSFYKERLPKCVCVCVYKRDADFHLTVIPCYYPLQFSYLSLKTMLQLGSCERHKADSLLSLNIHVFQLFVFAAL